MPIIVRANEVTMGERMDRREDE